MAKSLRHISVSTGGLTNSPAGSVVVFGLVFAPLRPVADPRTHLALVVVVPVVFGLVVPWLARGLTWRWW